MKYTWKNRNNPQNSSDLKVCDMEEKKKKNPLILMSFQKTSRPSPKQCM